MSQTENPLDARTLPFAVILAGIIILGGFGAIQTAGGPLPNSCTSTNGFCPSGPIAYVLSVSGNNTGVGAVTTSSWVAVTNQSMIVVGAVGASTVVHTMISNLTDTLGDTFSRKLIQQYVPGLDGNNIEIWFGQTKAAGLNSLTATWNFTDGLGTQILQANVYTGVSGTGATNSTSTSGTSATLTLKTIKNGSWIFGAVNLVNPVCPPPNIGTSSGFIRRIDTCQVIAGAGENEAESSDNATVLRNTFTLTYAPGGVGTQNDYAVIELTATDSEPLTPDFTTFCGPLQGTTVRCLNFAGKTSGGNTLANIVVGTNYCTGITTTGLTIATGHNLQVLAQYAGQSRNDTGAIILVEIIISTTVPPTTFGACTVGTIFGIGKIVFTTMGATLTQFGLNEYATAVNGVCISPTIPCNSAGTVYASLDIVPQSVGVGNPGSTILYAQWGSGTTSSSLSMFEIK